VHNYTNLPLSNGIKIVSVLQRHGEIWRTDVHLSVTDKQTDRQTDSQKLNVLGRLGGG